mgnify:CR=1 FL=1
MKILLIEDEQDLCNSIESYFKIYDYRYETVHSFADAIEKIELYPYDCILLDLNLPDGNGMDLIEKIKNNNNTGIIIISARDAINDRVTGLSKGADDYLLKPFDLAELNARIIALYRRLNLGGSNYFNIGNITVYPEERKAYFKDEEIKLTKSEFDILLFFNSNKNRVITKETIADHLWGEFVTSADTLDSVYTHIKNLRKKLQKYGADNLIKNVYGVGYKLETE